METTHITNQMPSLALDFTGKSIDYLVYGNGEKVECGHLALDSTLDDYRRAVENAVYDNAFLLSDYKSITAAIHSSHFLILPQELSDAAMARKMMEASFTRLEGDVLLCNVEGTQASVACDVDGGVVAFLRRTFPGAAVLHHLAPIIAYCIRAYGEDTACLHLSIDGSQAHIVVVKQGALQLANTYPYHSLDDVVYYALNVWKTCGLDARRDMLRLSGDNALRSQLAEQLRQWIANAMPEVMPAQALQLGRDAMGIPFNLLTLALFQS